jgi:hypothetical protein
MDSKEEMETEVDFFMDFIKTKGLEQKLEQEARDPNRRN